MTVPTLVIWGVLAVVGLHILIIMIKATLIWARTIRSGTPVSISDILSMRFRKSDASIIVNNLILLNDAQILDIGLSELENLYLAGGDVESVVSAIIQASKSRIILEWRVVEAYDLAGRDVLQLVTSAIQSGNMDELKPLLK